MKIERILKALHDRPFRPFAIHLADGGRIPVQHEDFVAINPAGRRVVVCMPDGTDEILDLMMITRLEISSPNGTASEAASLREEPGSTVGIEKIRALLHAEPFALFYLRLADGDRILIEHPDFVALRPDGREVLVNSPGGRSRMIDVASIRGLELQFGGE